MLRALGARLLEAAGCASEEAVRVAERLVEANLTGHDSHGVIRLPRYVTWLAEGVLVPGVEVEVLLDEGPLVLLDGRFGLGQTVGAQAVAIGCAKAREQGAAVIGLRRSGHLGRIADWAERAAAEGLVSLHLVNVAGSVLVAPFGAVERRMSTAPFAIGVPRPGKAPLLLDFATSVVSEGKVMVAAKGGKPVPPDALIGPDGAPSGDPALLYGSGEPTGSYRDRNGPGALRAMAGHKGSGLALMCELLAGALTGNGCAGPGPRHPANGMLSLYLDPGRLDREGGFAAEMEAFLGAYLAARPAPGAEVLLPGEPERRSRAERLERGIPLPEETRAALRECAARLGLEPPAEL